MAYASGKHAYFICDTCSFRYPYTTASISWDNFRVCKECYEPKHPQLDPPNITSDAETLWKPRPEKVLPKTTLGIIKTTNASAAGMTFASDPIGVTFEGYTTTTALGEITVVV